jgi:hypothetical protein
MNKPMAVPTVIHPKKFRINGFLIEVVSYHPLQDRQADSIALQFVSTHRLPQKDRGTVVQVRWTGDADQPPHA